MMMMMMMMKMKKLMNKVIMSTIEQDHHLSEDLILEILSYLPPITLLRFKSVSKTWYSLISNPDFRRRNTANYQLHRSNRHRTANYQLHRSNRHRCGDHSSPGILLRRNFWNWGSNIVIQPHPSNFWNWGSNIVIHPHPSGLDHEQKHLALLLENLNVYRPAALIESLTAPAKKESFRAKKESFKLADSCNGLLLYVHISSIRKEGEKKEMVCRTFYVCNPITKDYIKLPTIDMVVDIEEMTHCAQIVFNPSFSLTYKVFTWIQRSSSTISGSDSSNNYRLYVYSSQARSWRLSASIPLTVVFPMFFFCDLKAVLWNGVLHWTSLFIADSLNVDDDMLSLCYDLEKETVWKMKFPKMAMGCTHRKLLYFGLCGERLLMIQKSFKNNDLERFPTSFDVMELKQHNREGDGEDIWSVRYHVNFKEVDYDYYLRPKAITNSFMVHYVYILDIYRTMGRKSSRNKKGEEEEEEMLLIKVRSNKMISFSLTNNTFGLIKKIAANRKMDDFLYYTNILQYTITLCPPA